MSLHPMMQLAVDIAVSDARRLADAARLKAALEEIRDLIDGMADTEDVPDSIEVRPNVFMRIDQIIDAAL